MESAKEGLSSSDEFINAEEAANSRPHKTPMYEAINASRYHRQTLIKQIQDRTGNHLICYLTGLRTYIQRDDTIGFMEMLHNIPTGSNVDLLLHTGGGDIDAAEKLVTLVEATVGSARYRVIVPDSAKSAGTMMALGTDSIVMSDSSELGAIDPQITLQDGRGNRMTHSVLTYLDAYRIHTEALRADRDDPVAQLMLDKLDPTVVRQLEAVRDRARYFAESQLRRKNRNFSQIASDLMNISRWPSHGQMITWEDARDIGLDVEYLPPRSDEWQLYWRLYCLLRLSVKDEQRIFESDYASLTLDP